ncbi:MAG: redoxin domain-containing protein [Tepidiformaceae bacterium]
MTGEHTPATAWPPREAPIAAGDTAPDFELPAIDAAGSTSTLRLAEARAAGPVLLIFYQDDGMPICTSALKAFAQEHDLLAGAAVRVFGINTNGTGSHAKFQERDHFPFPLLSDFHGEVVKAFGLWDADEGKSVRALVVVGADGVVKHAQPHFNPGNVTAFEEVFRALGLA